LRARRARVARRRARIRGIRSRDEVPGNRRPSPAREAPRFVLRRRRLVGALLVESDAPPRTWTWVLALRVAVCAAIPPFVVLMLESGVPAIRTTTGS
jgi:hypothetical protein